MPRVIKICAAAVFVWGGFLAMLAVGAHSIEMLNQIGFLLLPASVVFWLGWSLFHAYPFNTQGD